MITVDIGDARTHLFKLVDLAAKGESFIIAKAGKPLVKVVALSRVEKIAPVRLGFMAGEIQVPDDFDRMGAKEIESRFSGRR